MTDITLWHNPKCSKSREALALIRTAGFEPRIVEYLKTPPTREELAALVAAGIPVRELLRSKEDCYTELGLDDPALTDDELLDALQANPALLNRPVARTPLGARVCRPPEVVREILPAT